MVQNSVRSVQHPIAFLTDLQAKIDIIKRDWKCVFVEATYLLKYLSPGRQAGSRNGADVPNDVWQIEVVLTVPLKPLKGVATVVENSHHHTGVLDSAVRIQKLCAHGAHFRTQG